MSIQNLHIRKQNPNLVKPSHITGIFFFKMLQSFSSTSIMLTCEAWVVCLMKIWYEALLNYLEPLLWNHAFIDEVMEIW